MRGNDGHAAAIRAIWLMGLLDFLRKGTASCGGRLEIVQVV